MTIRWSRTPLEQESDPPPCTLPGQVTDFLAMDGPPVPHQRLMERQLLQAWEPGTAGVGFRGVTDG